MFTYRFFIYCQNQSYQIKLRVNLVLSGFILNWGVIMQLGRQKYPYLPINKMGTVRWSMVTLRTYLHVINRLSFCEKSTKIRDFFSKKQNQGFKCYVRFEEFHSVTGTPLFFSLNGLKFLVFNDKGSFSKIIKYREKLKIEIFLTKKE